MALKEWYRDYATHAFMEFSALGYPTRETMEEKIRQDINRRLAMEEPGFIVVKADAAVLEREALLQDIDAVNRVLLQLRRENRDHIADAIREVYFLGVGGKAKKGTLTARVRRFAYEYPANEATVYRWLKKAREMFCEARGLCTTEERW